MFATLALTIVGFATPQADGGGQALQPRTLDDAALLTTGSSSPDFSAVGGRITFDFGDAELRLGLMPDEQPTTASDAGGGEGGSGRGGDSTEELAKKTQNPVSDLISVPFQNNFNFNTGPDNQVQWVLNV